MRSTGFFKAGFTRSAVCLLGLAAAGYAQTTGPAGTQPAGPSAVETLISQRVPGIRPDMTMINLMQLAASAVKERDLPRAQKIYAALLQQDSQNVYAMVGLASAYEAEGQEARKSADPEVAKRADLLLKASGEWYLKAGHGLLAVRSYADAEKAFLRVLATRHKDPQAQLGLARTYAATGSRDLNAVDYYRDYIENPQAAPDTLAQAHLELAQIRRRSKLPNLALDALQNALKRDRENPEIYAEMARTYYEMSESPKALAAVDMALKYAPNRPEFLNLKAQLLLARRDLDAAQKFADQAIRLVKAETMANPERHAAWRSLHEYYGTYQQILEMQLAAHPERTLVRVDLVRVVQERNAVAEILSLYAMLDILRRAPGSEARNPRLLEAQIEVLWKLRLSDPARNIARQLLQIEPGNPIAQGVLDQPTTQAAR